jgi:hypothetical protein
MKKRTDNVRPRLSWKLSGVVIISLLLLLVIVFIFYHYRHLALKPEQRWIISQRGIFDVFDEGLTDANGKTVFCETSAVAYDGTNLIFASDKPIPSDSLNQRSSVFYIDYLDFPSATVEYCTAPAFVEAIKYEDFTVTPDGQYVIATTGFDRVHYAGTSEWDNYNTILIWPVGDPDEARVVSSSTVDGVTSSVGLREKISSALRTEEFPDGVPYFKIEGLAAIPGNQLLFGIRELGATYEVFDYAVMIISVSYEIVDGQLLLSDDYQLVYDYNPTEKLSEHGGITVGLSSIEYDQYHDRLYLLTSYEKKSEGEITDEDIGAFLWFLPVKSLKTGVAPELVVKRPDSTPLLFAHKGEGVAVIDRSRVIIIHDDDRVLGRENIEDPETQFSRQPHQAAYTIVDLEE